MLFRPDGSDIPDELVALQEKGDTVFVCGAGVSRMVGSQVFVGLLKASTTNLAKIGGNTQLRGRSWKKAASSPINTIAFSGYSNDVSEPLISHNGMEFGSEFAERFVALSCLRIGPTSVAT